MKKILLLLPLLILAAGLSAQTVFNQNFDNGMDGWTAVSMSNNNNCQISCGSSGAHSGSCYFKFSCYYSASDYSQYLISPRMSLTNTARMTYWCRDIEARGGESFEIMVSTTDSNISSFSALGASITPLILVDHERGAAAPEHQVRSLSLYV